MRNLKPCPFCGGSPEYQKQNIVFLEHFECDCGCTLVGGRKAWNTRAGLPPTTEQIMADPRVQAMVEALGWCINALEMDYTGSAIDYEIPMDVRAALAKARGEQP